MSAGCGNSRKSASGVAPPHLPIQRPDDDFAKADSPSLQILPGPEEPDWHLEEDATVVPGDRLSAVLGTDGEQLRRYGALDMTSAKYAQDNGGFATIEIVRFPDLTRAFGAYSMRKDGLLRLLNIPNESFEKVHSVHVWRGEIYLRVIGSSPDAGAITRLAGVVAGKIPPAAGKPEVLALFPEKGRVVNTERYSMTSAFGQRFLGNAFLASFNIDGDRIEGLIIPSASKSAATRILDQYRQLYVRNGKLLDPITNLGDEDFAAEDRYLGRVVALRIDRYVVAFNGFRDRQHLVALAAETAQRIAKAP